jgi:hypothetical protein
MLHRAGNTRDMRLPFEDSAMRNVLATTVAAGLLACAPMMAASGLQSTETFADAQVSIPTETNAINAARIFCTQHGFTGAESYDVDRLIAIGGGTYGMAHFNSITCRSYTPVATSGGFLPDGST